MPITLPAMTESTESLESQVSLYTKNKHLQNVKKSRAFTQRSGGSLLSPN